MAISIGENRNQPASRVVNLSEARAKRAERPSSPEAKRLEEGQRVSNDTIALARSHRVDLDSIHALPAKSDIPNTDAALRTVGEARAKMRGNDEAKALQAHANLSRESALRLM